MKKKIEKNTAPSPEKSRPVRGKNEDGKRKERQTDGKGCRRILPPPPKDLRLLGAREDQHVRPTLQSHRKPPTLSPAKFRQRIAQHRRRDEMLLQPRQPGARRRRHPRRPEPKQPRRGQGPARARGYRMLGNRHHEAATDEDPVRFNVDVLSPALHAGAGR